jgi:pimeloyl-ACP methyl ester carboxylesterase
MSLVFTARKGTLSSSAGCARSNGTKRISHGGRLLFVSANVRNSFKNFAEDVSLMGRTQPNYSAHDLAKISVPVVIVQGEHDEFIEREHAEYLARSIPNADFVVLNGVSHFAPLQRPRQFDAAVLEFVAKVLPKEGGNGTGSTT